MYKNNTLRSFAFRKFHCPSKTANIIPNLLKFNRKRFDCAKKHTFLHYFTYITILSDFSKSPFFPWLTYFFPLCPSDAWCGWRCHTHPRHCFWTCEAMANLTKSSRQILDTNHLILVAIFGSLFWDESMHTGILYWYNLTMYTLYLRSIWKKSMNLNYTRETCLNMCDIFSYDAHSKTTCLLCFARKQLHSIS